MQFKVSATFYHYQIRRELCFYTMFPYVFAHCLQTGTVWVLSLDLLITILFPIKSRRFYTPTYLSILFFLPVIYGVISVIFGFIFLDNAVLSVSLLEIFKNLDCN